MTDIRDRRLLWLKAGLFVALGLLASAALLIEHPSTKIGVLLAIAVWAFCRAYYFAFYVIEHYIDGDYKFTGLWSVMRYLLSRTHSSRSKHGESRNEPEKEK